MPSPLRSFASLSTALVSLLLLNACTSEAPPQAPPPPAVSVIEVGSQEVGEYWEAVARTEAYKSVDLKARVEGVITKRLFIEGQDIDKDQLLFEIDRANYEAKLEEAEANLKSAQAERKRTARDYERGKDLRPKGYISQSDLDTLASNAAKASASEKAAEAALHNAQVNLDYTHIRAPFEGTIGTVRYNVGNLVGPNSDPLATLIQDNPIYANFQIDEKSYITYIQEFIKEYGDTTPPQDLTSITLMLPNGTSHTHKGRINYAGIEVNPTTGSVELRAEFPNPDRIVRPGLYATLVIESTESARLPVIPQYAVQQGQQGRFVLVVDDSNRVKSRAIQVGRRIESLWVVTSGLKEGDRLIVDGLQKVRSGVIVQPVMKQLDPKTGTLKASAETPNDEA
ncbi:efflux RND transporter periplasmic adaptor subunit [Pseudomaricurvus alkylphenolicus]|jgi:membrane fusion protein (multidrug efflux system)|uniref:efflux RND transporter periplasmic adaptor subunit n=1 Tax=Pseudomaricurvus alkylphenolicus TaxID=1306991 RepID=UPI001422B511|nr:efflux RND transporter periplasmic adaptor subunit [Pseudomaricurvus alkylphenolicus]NIB39356.1 efflux RND transporter periplasmic adaptor subunit [Pseudomaricurvus alkylphenolicus]